MRVLLDECVPRTLKWQFPAHDIWTIRDMGWAGKKNGELLALMKANGFEVLLTVDRNLRFQQNLAAAGIAVVVMVAVSNRPSDLFPVVPAVEVAFATIRPGDVLEVS
jgi:predicted nuclease of predicted toxin-antitoxin system